MTAFTGIAPKGERERQAILALTSCTHLDLVRLLTDTGIAVRLCRRCGAMSTGTDSTWCASLVVEELLANAPTPPRDASSSAEGDEWVKLEKWEAEELDKAWVASGALAVGVLRSLPTNVLSLLFVLGQVVRRMREREAAG